MASAEYWSVAHANSSDSPSFHGRRTLATMPEDIFLQICAWLSVSDILSFRLANRTIYEYTARSSIWLSLARRLKLALPPAQPVFHRSFGDDNNYRPNLEFFVSRALKLEQSWKDYNPLAQYYKFNGHQRVLSMRFLPGGKHMVTVSQDPETNKESVVVWDMNFRGRRNHIAIAMLNSETPVLKLHVRYALNDGQICLFVAFTRPPQEGRTVINAAYVPVEILDILSSFVPGSAAFLAYSNQVPHPFKKILDTRTQYPIGAMSLSDIDGCPILATVHRPRTVAFFDLHSNTRAILKLGAVPGYVEWRHSIWDIKILSSQKQVLVIRVLIGAVNMMDSNPLVFEIYDIPTAGAEVHDPVPHEKRLILDQSVDGFFVSDGDASWNFRTHPNPDVPMLHTLARCPPPPISIFVTTKSPRGFLHFLMLPEVKDEGRNGVSDITYYAYKLPVGTHAQYTWEEEETAVILPGAYRSVVWMRSTRRQPPQGREVVRLAVYRTEGYPFSDSLDTGHTSESHVAGSASTSSSEFNDISMHLDEGHGVNNVEHPQNRAMKFPAMPIDVANAMRNGTRCLQFDEWLGRLCVATTENDLINVLDWSL